MSGLTWTVPVDLLSRSISIMRPHGASGNEGLALWFGHASDDRTDITHVVEVYGPGFRTSPLHMSLSLRAMSTLTDLVERLDRALVGQIHSHPARMLGLSALDIEQGIRVRGYLSVVCPFYAQRDIARFEECGVHVFESGTYRRLTLDQVADQMCFRTDRAAVVRCEVGA